MAVAAAYLAAEGYEEVLAEELTRKGVAISHWHGALALSPAPPVMAAWSLNTWTAPRSIAIASISDAAAALRAMQRNWGGFAVEHHRRMALIQAKLPVLRPKPMVFPAAAPAGHLGAWTLLEPDILLASATQTSPWINGAPVFVQDRQGPPSRAYLKLWEAFARLGTWPQPGDRCLDLGAAPGGWTQVLGALGAQVQAVDRAPLDAAVAAMANVQVRRADAFDIDPLSEGYVDWLFSDVIAYPQRALVMVRKWIAAGCAGRIVCTLKFQGATDHDAADAFAAIAGGRVCHLFHNKHELTFLWQRQQPALPGV